MVHFLPRVLGFDVFVPAAVRADRHCFDVRSCGLLRAMAALERAPSGQADGLDHPSKERFQVRAAAGFLEEPDGGLGALRRREALDELELGARDARGARAADRRARPPAGSSRHGRARGGEPRVVPRIQRSRLLLRHAGDAREEGERHALLEPVRHEHGGALRELRSSCGRSLARPIVSPFSSMFSAYERVRPSAASTTYCCRGVERVGRQHDGRSEPDAQ